LSLGYIKDRTRTVSL